MRRLLCGVLVVAASMVFASSAMAEPFGVKSLEVAAVNKDGSPDTQAGSHPYALTTSFTLNPPEEFDPQEELFARNGEIKDVRAELPPGFVGNPNATPQCGYLEFSKHRCPDDTVIGETQTVFTNAGGRFLYNTVPVFNMEPPAGIPAQFGYFVKGLVPVFLDTTVRTGGDYGLTVNVHNIDQVLQIYGSTVTIWGVPADPSHNKLRGKCLGENENGNDPGESLGECPVNVPVEPLLTNPTSCGVPRTVKLSVDSWEEPGHFVSMTATLPELSGCEKLDFSPSIVVTPDGTAGSTPTGLRVDLHLPQESTVNPVGLAEADVKNTKVTLPAGVQLSPSAADGLMACSEAQIGLHSGEPATCPDASKVGTVEINTPLLPEPLTGSVYLAAQEENPFDSLIALYVEVENPRYGVRVKVAGKTVPDPVTGQLVSTFENTPQFPFSDFKLDFFGTARAPLATPPLCGSYTTETSIEPWSATPAVDPASKFQIASGPAGSPCANPLPFAPALTAGTTSIQAGGFTPFTMTMSREDGEQNLQSIVLHMPMGLSGTLSTVKLCDEEQANAGTCGPESLIGETVVSVGLGGDPFTVRGGKVYITGPYKDAPFGLSIVNPAKAGPFNLGQVVVRAKIEVNEETAALTVTTDTEGPYKIPTIIDGIPLQIKHVNVSIGRPDFMFNPTNCSPLAITGTLGSSEGSTSALSLPFQVTNCAVLAFKPQLTASTSGKTSKANGTSLSVKLGYPAGPYDANISRVKVELPKQLPSRLTTLRKACLASTFEANPAGCPPASIIGQASATTPELPVPLNGPAYFVSNGGQAFPSLIIVLQGYGVTIHLVGTTFISKAGITSSTFKTVPDAPVGNFELTLPQGPFSALTTDGDLCKSRLTMPTEFVGQNGAVIETSTKIAVTGCAKAKKTTHHKKKKAKAKRKTGKGKSTGGGGKKR